MQVSWYICLIYHRLLLFSVAATTPKWHYYLCVILSNANGFNILKNILHHNNIFKVDQIHCILGNTRKEPWETIQNKLKCTEHTAIHVYDWFPLQSIKRFINICHMPQKIQIAQDILITYYALTTCELLR